MTEQEIREFQILKYLNQNHVRKNINLEDSALRIQFEYTEHDFNIALNNLLELKYADRRENSCLKITEDGGVKYNEWYKQQIETLPNFEKEEISVLKRKGIPKDIVVKLRNKAGNICSFPECNNNLVTTDGRLLGEICTIKPISLNGPRADQKTSIEEYYSENNLIYLCPTHHRLIDLEPETYTVDFLYKIKQKHEAKYITAITITLTKIEIPDGLSLDQIIKFWDENKYNASEEFWQVFFSKHPQIISFLFPNPIVKFGEKTYFGGKDLNNKGGNIGDYIFQNKLAKSVVIVEIKTPHTKVLGSKYRANSYSISDELTGAIVQTLNYKTEIQRDFHRLVYETKSKFEVVEPSCMVIIGNLENEILDNKQMRSLDLFRNTLNNFTIITYDELFEKLKMIKELKA